MAVANPFRNGSCNDDKFINELIAHNCGLVSDIKIHIYFVITGLFCRLIFKLFGKVVSVVLTGSTIK